MKKRLSIVVVLLLILSLTACGKEKVEPLVRTKGKTSGSEQSGGQQGGTAQNGDTNNSGTSGDSGTLSRQDDSGNSGDSGSSSNSGDSGLGGLLGGLLGGGTGSGSGNSDSGSDSGSSGLDMGGLLGGLLGGGTGSGSGNSNSGSDSGSSGLDMGGLLGGLLGGGTGSGSGNSDSGSDSGSSGLDMGGLLGGLLGGGTTGGDSGSGSGSDALGGALGGLLGGLGMGDYLLEGDKLEEHLNLFNLSLKDLEPKNIAKTDPVFIDKSSNNGMDQPIDLVFYSESGKTTLDDVKAWMKQITKAFQKAAYGGKLYTAYEYKELEFDVDETIGDSYWSSNPLCSFSYTREKNGFETQMMVDAMYNADAEVYTLKIYKYEY